MVTFGPSLSFFAKSPSGIIWHNLPAGLEEQINLKKAKDPACTPSHVSLGISGAWAAIWPDGTDSWNFQGQYIDLAAQLSEKSRETLTVSL